MKKLKKTGGYRSSFDRNIHERTDLPVFSVEDAIKQIKDDSTSDTILERSMDDFFLKHLPDELISADGRDNDLELNEKNIKMKIKEGKDEILKKNKT